MNDSKNDEINNKDRVQKALSYCYSIIKRKIYTENEIRIKVSRKFGEYIVDALIVRLKKEDLVNDKIYIELWVRDRIELHPEGIIKMKFELKRKGIPDSIINDYFRRNSVNENVMIRKLIKKKMKSNGINRDKLYNFLLRRGFVSEKISNILNEYY
jgi:regulatory protein